MMARHGRLIVAALLAAGMAGGCAASGNGASSLPGVPVSAQYSLEYDWSYALSPDPVKALGAAPLELGNIAVDHGVVYAGSYLGRVVAIDGNLGEKLWQADLGMPVTSGPVVTPQAVFVALSDGSIRKLRKDDGAQLWRFDTGASVENSLSVADGVVSCVNANNRIFALDEQSGALLWRRERPRSNEFTMYGQCPPYASQGVVYAGFSDGVFTAYAQDNGTAIWSRDLAPNARFKDVDARPVIQDGAVYVASSSGGLYALSADDGSTVWQRQISGISSIRVFQDAVYIASQSGIYQLDRRTGRTVWQNVIQKEALISPIALGRRYIYAAVQRYGIVMIDRKTGVLRHAFDNGYDATSAPVLDNGSLTVFTNKSTLYRYRVDDAPLD